MESLQQIFGLGKGRAQRLYSMNTGPASNAAQDKKMRKIDVLHFSTGC